MIFLPTLPEHDATDRYLVESGFGELDVAKDAD
jgi:hypothetical protein